MSLTILIRDHFLSMYLTLTILYELDKHRTTSILVSVYDTAAVKIRRDFLSDPGSPLDSKLSHRKFHTLHCLLSLSESLRFFQKYFVCKQTIRKDHNMKPTHSCLILGGNVITAVDTTLIGFLCSSTSCCTFHQCYPCLLRVTILTDQLMITLEGTRSAKAQS